MDIRELDEAALADDAVMRDLYDLSRRAELLGREDAPFWPWEECIGAYRSADSGERQQLFAAYDGARMISAAALWSAVLKIAGVVVLGAIMSILDITVVGVAQNAFQTAWHTTPAVTALDDDRLHARPGHGHPAPPAGPPTGSAPSGCTSCRSCCSSAARCSARRPGASGR